MTLVPTPNQLSDVPPLLWLWSAALLFCAATLGMVAGIWYERGATARALKAAKESLSELIALAARRIESAHEACGLLEEAGRLAMTDDEAGRLERLQAQLTDRVSRVLERRTTAATKATAPKRPPEPFQLEWVCEPACSSGFPSREAFDLSLLAMLAAGRRAEVSSALLLVKIDRLDGLVSRFGDAGAERLAQKLGGVLCRAIRDEDLVCRTAEDAFAVLLPNVSGEDGRRLAEAVRSSVRQYHFRLDESGEEILVTANFGYAGCDPFDNAELVLNRAGDALARSVKRGRNQLHLHDGRHVVASA